MNIFGVGEVELVLVLLIALIVAGPKRMIQWMYTLGRWTAHLRRMWGEAVVTIQHEIDEAGLDIEVPKEPPTRGTLRKMTYDAIRPLAEPVKEVVDEVRSVSTEIDTTVQQTRNMVRGLGDDVRATGRQLTAPPTSDTTGSDSAADQPVSSQPINERPVNDRPANGHTQPTTDQPSDDEKPSDGPFGTWSSRKE